MKQLRLLFGCALLGAAAIGGFRYTDDMLAATPPGSSGRPGGGDVAVLTQPVETLTFSETVEAVGTTLARQSVVLRPSAAGRVTEVSFEAGDRVSTGDVLLRLDDAEARAALASAEATVSEASAAFERQQQLQERGSAAEATLQSARAALLRAEAERDMAINTLQDRVLRAPFDGLVGLTDIALGQLIDSSDEITTLDDLSVVEVAFNVPERFIARLARGQSVSLTSPAYPDETFEATIGAIDTRVDQSTRSIALRATVPNDDGRLTAGMFMRVSLVLDRRQAPAVPERALSVAGAMSYIHVVEGGTARRVAVSVGAQQGDMIEVSGELVEGTAVIVSNLHRVDDGMTVELIEPASTETLASDGES
ncbi:efflux RND transporter periplasmic adaptor subunit [Marinibacterium profundimaris]|uniref:efflux RND transporter periplasmic adaptor subunit n=1 Tax=Marinibacterium profundimaris TaxID=1679460 RepID=UPI00117C17B0|nr:efflux RND transporter periplasmic adaptor subunit [Marinibacterium profundimaris]